MILLISYDLSKPDRDYKGLYGAIKKASGWWHYLESTWLISTKGTADDWYKELKPNIDNDDSLLIVEITGNRQGWLPKKAWDWIKNNS